MLRFTKRKSGTWRTTVTVRYAIDLETLAFAVALDRSGQANQVARLTKADCERILRRQLQVHGPPEQWADPSGVQFDELLDDVLRAVYELWGEAPG